MTENIWSKLTARKATPQQISNNMYQDSEVPVEGLLGKIDSSVLEGLCLNKGEINPDKLASFKGSLENLMAAGYTPQQIIKIDKTCIENDGTVNGKKFRRLLHEIKSPHFWEGNI